MYRSVEIYFADFSYGNDFDKTDVTILICWYFASHTAIDIERINLCYSHNG